MLSFRTKSVKSNHWNIFYLLNDLFNEKTQNIGKMNERKKGKPLQQPLVFCHLTCHIDEKQQIMLNYRTESKLSIQIFISIP